MITDTSGLYLGVGPFNVIGHVPFDSFVLTADGREHRDVVFDHSAAFAAWGPVVVELGQVRIRSGCTSTTTS